MEYKILLYYKYVHIENPVKFCEEHKLLLETLGLNGRIIIAEEGINGTVEGTSENCAKYISNLKSDPRFEDMDIKVSEGTGTAFPKLSCKVRSEIVSAHLGNEDLNPNEVTGKYLSVDELHQWYEDGKDFIIIDMRNNYEHLVGHFKNSILPNMDNFRDLPKFLPDLDKYKDKTVVTVCTGGVRCEKASGYLVKHGFKDVYQLHNGMVTYMEKYPNTNFLGLLYVFDGRVVMGFKTDDPSRTIVGKCEICQCPSELYHNCDNLMCHKHFIACKDCADENGMFYCSECKYKMEKSQNVEKAV